MGSANAAVLPVPVWAIPTTSCRDRATGMVRSWIGVGVRYFSSDKARTIGMEATPLFGEEFDKFVAAENNRWGEKVREAGIEAE